MNKRLCTVLAVLLAAAMFAGCSSSSAPAPAPSGDTAEAGDAGTPPPEGDRDSVEEGAGTVSLAGWEGTWNSFSTYFQDPALDEAYEILSQRDGTTAADVKERYMEGDTYRCEIASIGVYGDVITVYGAPQNTVGGEDGILSRARYAYQGAVTDGSGRAWDCFTTGDDALYSTFLLLEAEADVPGETMVHFHFRYGDDADTLLARDGWYPTMIAYDSTPNLIVGHMTFEED